MRYIVTMVIATIMGAVLMLPSTATATGPVPQTGNHGLCYETVVDQPAYDETVFDYWQRYSWTGGPIADGVVPTFPSDDWQPNVKGDPHNIGKAGAYDVSHGGAGKADWFYLEAVTKIVHHDATYKDIEVPCAPVVTTETESKTTQLCVADYQAKTFEFVRTRTVTDGVPGPWSKYVATDNTTIVTDNSCFPFVEQISETRTSSACVDGAEVTNVEYRTRDHYWYDGFLGLEDWTPWRLVDTIATGAACDTPLVTTPEVPKFDNPAPVANDQVLPSTGSDSNRWYIVGGILMLLIGVGILIWTMRRVN